MHCTWSDRLPDQGIASGRHADAGRTRFVLNRLGLHASLLLRQYRIDEHHSNAYAEWKRMGSPVAPDLRQYARLQEASNLASREGFPATLTVPSGAATIRFNLPRQGVSLLIVRCP